MNLSEGKTTATQSTSGNYTEEIILRLESVAQNLGKSTESIKDSLNRIVGHDLAPDEGNKIDTKAVRDGGFGRIHEIIDDIFITTKINQENSEKLNRII